MMIKKWNFLMCGILCQLALSITATAAVNDPNIISGAVAINGTAPEPLEIVGGGLEVGALTHVDRTYVFDDVAHRAGIDYVKTAVDDKTDPDVEYHITVNKSGTLYLFIDNRVGDDNSADPPTLTSVMTWVDPNFTQSDFALTTGDVSMTAYEQAVTAGTYTLYEQNDGSGRVMYLVAAVPDNFNYPPEILNVSSSYQVAPGEDLVIDANVIDYFGDNVGVASYLWEQLDPNITVSFSPDAVSEDVTISFPAGVGVYTIGFTATDNDGGQATKTIEVSVQIPTFAVESPEWCTAGNDDNQSENTYRHSSISYARNHSAPRRRIEYVQYDISGLKEAGKVFANSYLTMNRDKGSLNEVLSVFALNEDVDNVDISNESSTAVWNNLPGVVNTPAPPYSDPVTYETHIDKLDVSPLLFETTIEPLDVWVDTASYAALDEILNADDDGVLTLMFATFSPEDADFEICSPSHSRSLDIDGTTYKGIILRGNIMIPTWATEPVPAINTTQSTSLAQLSWTNPSAVGTLTSEVWIGTGDPNTPVGSGDGFTLLPDGDNTDTTVSLSSYTLTSNLEYNWVVVLTDDGTGKTTQGYTWTFNTNNAYPTVTMENNYQYLWLNNDGDPSSATAVINATAEDPDAFPNPTLALLWEQVSGPATVTIDPNDVEDITLTLPATGTYVFQLSANDGDLVGTGATEIFVGDTPCDAAQAKPGYEDTVGDINSDCYVNLVDAAMLFENWLVCHPFMDAPCAP